MQVRGNTMARERMSKIERYTFSLNQRIAADPQAYKAIGRDKEIEDAIICLSRRTKNDPLFIGEPGVGKTALVEGLVRRILMKEVPKELQDKDIRSLQMSSLPEDGFSEIFQGIIDEVRESDGHYVLFIDEIHTIVGTHSANAKNLDAANILKPALARGEIQLIGATTIEEYHDYIEPDGALKRRFEVILLPEPTIAQAKDILLGVKSTYELFHQVTISDEAAEACVDLSVRYIYDKYLPDKALDLIDKAASVAHVHNEEIVTKKTVAKVLQREIGVPLTMILKDNTTRINEIKEKLERRVKGQDHAIAAVYDAISISQAGLADPKRPIASFLFLGTTGTGKTELSKALAEAMFDSEDEMIRIDTSEFQDKNAAQRLIGTDSQRGILTEAVKHKPYSIVLFDEIEKGDRSVQDLLLQVLQDGILHDHYGREVSLRNTIVIMTTNLAAETIDNQENYNSSAEGARKEAVFEKQVNDALKLTFRPEFINRIDSKVIFHMLDLNAIHKVCRKNLAILADRMRSNGWQFEYEDRIIDYLSADGVGFDPANGARPMKRAVDRYIGAPISRIILKLQQENNPQNIRRIVAKVSGKSPRENGDRYGTWKIEFKGFKSTEDSDAA